MVCPCPLSDWKDVKSDFSNMLQIAGVFRLRNIIPHVHLYITIYIVFIYHYFTAFHLHILIKSAKEGKYTV